MSFARLGSLRSLAASAFIAMGVIALPSSSIGQDEIEAPATSNENSAASTENPVKSDMVFVSGEEVVASQSTTDDLFAAGGTVETKGASADHLFLAGGDITVSEAQVSDVVAAGGEIRLNAANVADDVIVAGGEIITKESFDIGGSAVVAGGTVRFESPVGQDLRIRAGEIYLNSTVAGTVRLSGDTIELGPNTRIGGDLLYRGQSLTIDPAAVIEGNRTELPMSESYAAEEFGKGVGQFFLVFGLSILVSYFVIVALLVFAVPRLMRSTSDMLQSKPWQALGIGVLYALIVPVLGFALVWTVVGIPLAILLFLASLALTPFAIAVTAHFVGISARRIVTKKTGPTEGPGERILWPLAGVIILFALALIPLVGILVQLLALLFGLGAFLKQAAGALSTPAASPEMTSATA